MSYNQIDKIAGLPFPNKLETIELNDNCIQKIDDKTFQYCQTLIKLDLSGNQIKSYKWCIKLKELTVIYFIISGSIYLEIKLKIFIWRDAILT